MFSRVFEAKHHAPFYASEKDYGEAPTGREVLARKERTNKAA